MYLEVEIRRKVGPPQRRKKMVRKDSHVPMFTGEMTVTLSVAKIMLKLCVFIDYRVLSLYCLTHSPLNAFVA